MKISVVVPTYNRRWALEKSLATIFAQDLSPSEYEVIVVIDGSTDGTAESLRKLRTDRYLRVLERPHRERSAARNDGWRAANAPLVLFLDDDILCEPGMLRAHLAIQKLRGPAVVKGAVFATEDSPPSLAADWMFAHCNDWTLGMGTDLSVPWPQHTTVMANTSVPRSALEQVRGYDESLCTREATELALRLGKLGIPFYYAPDATGRHYYTKDVRAVLRDATLYGAEEVRLCRRHPEYKPFSALARAQSGPLWKRVLRRTVVRFGALFDLALEPPSLAAERWHRFTMVRIIGVRILKIRAGIAMYRAAVGEAGSWRALLSECVVPIAR
jgi:glycosyltransferase involved in cell wall biosynthesis